MDTVSPHSTPILSNILRFKDLQRCLRLSRGAIRARIAANDFPKPLVLGSRAVGWHASDIEAWLASRPRASMAASKIKDDVVSK